MAFGFDSHHLDAFIDIPFQIYKKDRQWIPPTRSSVKAQLDRSNPWFGRGEACHFLIPGKGRASAFRTAGDPVGHIGYFESVEEYAVAERLLAAATGWLQAKDCTTVRGPVNFDTWHSYRFVIGGQDRLPPFLLEPYNPPYYPAFWERFGFQASARYFSNLSADLAATAASLARHHEKAVQAGFRFRPLDPRRFDEELRLLYELSGAIFRGNWGYREIGFEEFEGLYAGAKRILDPGLCVVADHPDHGPVGLLFGIPDHGPAVRAAGGRGGLLGAARFLLARRKPETALLKTIGVTPAARGTNVGFAMCYLHYRHMIASGYRQGIHALMIEDNTSRRMSAAKGGEVVREYAVYDLVA